MSTLKEQVERFNSSEKAWNYLTDKAKTSFEVACGKFFEDERVVAYLQEVNDVLFQGTGTLREPSFYTFLEGGFIRVFINTSAVIKLEGKVGSSNVSFGLGIENKEGAFRLETLFKRITQNPYPVINQLYITLEKPESKIARFTKINFSAIETRQLFENPQILINKTAKLIADSKLLV